MHADAGAQASGGDVLRAPNGGHLPVEVVGEIREGGGGSHRVVRRGDPVRDVVGSDVDASPPSTAVTSQVMIIVAAKAGSSETKCTFWTTRVSGPTSASAVALPRAWEASA